MAICKNYRFATEVISHLHIEYHVSSNILVSYQVREVTFLLFHSIVDLWHILAYWIEPKVVVISLSKSMASLTDFDILILNFCVVCQYFDLTFCIIDLRFFSVYGTHKANVW